MLRNAKIYKIISRNTTKCYIGSTCNTLPRRLAAHIAAMNTRNSPVNEILSKGNYRITLIASYPNISRKKLLQTEGEYQRKMKSVNRKIAGRSKAMWYIDNAKRIQTHRGKKIRCSCGRKVNRSNLRRHKKSIIHKNKL